MVFADQISTGDELHIFQALNCALTPPLKYGLDGFFELTSYNIYTKLYACWCLHPKVYLESCLVGRSLQCERPGRSYLLVIISINKALGGDYVGTVQDPVS